jgi:hypothetical protein
MHSRWLKNDCIDSGKNIRRAGSLKLPRFHGFRWKPFGHWVAEDSIEAVARIAAE